MQDDFKQVASFPEPLLANVAKTRLESAGIPCYLTNENTIRMDFFYSQLLGGVRLYVHKDDFDKATALLEETIEPPIDPTVPADPAPFKAPACPKCRDRNVYDDRRPRLVTLVGFYLGLPLAFFRRQSRCANCGHTWKPAK